MRLPRVVRALQAGSALSPVRRAWRSGRGWRGWLAAPRRWQRCAPRGLALLFITHDPQAASAIAQRTLWMRDGQITPHAPTRL